MVLKIKTNFDHMLTSYLDKISKSKPRTHGLGLLLSHSLAPFPYSHKSLFSLPFSLTVSPLGVWSCSLVLLCNPNKKKKCRDEEEVSLRWFCGLTEVGSKVSLELIVWSCRSWLCGLVGEEKQNEDEVRMKKERRRRRKKSR